MIEYIYVCPNCDKVHAISKAEYIIIMATSPFTGGITCNACDTPLVYKKTIDTGK